MSKREGRSVAWWLESLRDNLGRWRADNNANPPQAAKELVRLNNRLAEELERAIAVAEKLDLEMIQHRTKLTLCQKLIVMHRHKLGPRIALDWLRNLTEFIGYRRNRIRRRAG